MKIDTVACLAASEDAELRALAVERLVRTDSLKEDDSVSEERKRLLRDYIPSLELGQVLSLLERHGDLGCPARFVERLIALLPSESVDQMCYFHIFGVANMLARKLDADGYADFAERVLPRIVQPHFQREVASHLSGCAFFNELVLRDSQRGEWSIVMAPTPLAARVLELRRDEAALRARVAELIAEASRPELLRLEWVLYPTANGDLTRQAQQRLVDGFEIKTGFDADPQSDVAQAHFEFVIRLLATEAADRPARLQWFTDRLAKLEAAGSWFHAIGYGEKFPPALLRELTILLIDRGEPPRWAGPILLERVGSRRAEAWNDVFRWWNRFPHHGLAWDHRAHKAILTHAPLPESAPADFDEGYLRCARDLIAFERGQVEHFRRFTSPRDPAKEEDELPPMPLDHALFLNPQLQRQTEHLRPLFTVEIAVGRLLELELTAVRADGIARLLKGHPQLLRHPRIGEVAAVAPRIDARELPAFEAFDLRSEEQVALYRSLTGAAGDARLRAHLRAAIVAEDGALPAEDRFHIPSVLFEWPWTDEFLDEALRGALRARIVEAPLHIVLAWLRTIPGVVDDRLLCDVAQRHLENGARWDRFDLIPALRPFVEQRVQRTVDDRELLTLLDWLEKLGLPRAAKLDAILAEITRRPSTREHGVPEQIGTLLPTRSAWERDGARLLRALLHWNDWSLIHRAWFGLYRAMRPAPAAPDAPAKRSEEAIGGIVTAAHLAFATVLLELASRAAEAHDEGRLLALLSAVLKLDPPPSIVPMLRRLTRWPDLSARATERIDLATTLFKSSTGRTATFDALVEATGVMLQFSAASTASEA